jgi:hypothetical protein
LSSISQRESDNDNWRSIRSRLTMSENRIYGNWMGNLGDWNPPNFRKGDSCMFCGYYAYCLFTSRHMCRHPEHPKIGIPSQWQCDHMTHDEIPEDQLKTPDEFLKTYEYWTRKLTEVSE